MARKTRGWTPKLRARQAARCRKQEPWRKSSGPKTESGKAAISQNALKHGLRSAEFRELCALLRAHAALTKAVAEEARDR